MNKSDILLTAIDTFYSAPENRSMLLTPRQVGGYIPQESRMVHH